MRKLVETEVIVLEHVQSSLQFADIPTKPLKATVSKDLRVGIGVCKYSS